jgi:hypothetical protein
MDVFEALGLDMPDNTRSMSVTDADADLAGVLGPLFGWDEKDASANRCVCYLHDILIWQAGPSRQAPAQAQASHLLYLLVVDLQPHPVPW